MAKTKAQLEAEIVELNNRLEKARKIYKQQERTIQSQKRTIESLRVKAAAFDQINNVAYKTYTTLHPKAAKA